MRAKILAALVIFPACGPQSGDPNTSSPSNEETGGSSTGGAPHGSGGMMADASTGGLTPGAGGSATGGALGSGGADGTGGTTTMVVPHLLLMTKVADGEYRHDSIADGVELLQEIAEEQEWELTATEDSSLFTPDGLASYTGVIFLSAAGDILDSDQEAAFRGFIESGGHFASLHSACYAEYDWDWYGDLIVARFKNHSYPEQVADIHLEMVDHPANAGLPAIWTREEEWYNFTVNPRSQVDVLMTVDEDTYDGGEMGDDHPIAWVRTFGASRVFVTGLGHLPEYWHDPTFKLHILGGLKWAFASGK